MFNGLTDIIKKVSDLKEEHKVIWFRGHSKTAYKLNSGLYRIDKDVELVRRNENDIYNSFLNYGHCYSNNFFENKDWNILFLMQHYGLYTRLLDWTDSLITALYFATCSQKEGETACIWVLDPIALNRNCTRLYDGEDKGFDGINLLTLETLPKRINKYTSYFQNDINIKSFAIMPRRSNDRLVSQSGFFTVQGTEGKPLEEEYSYHFNKFIYKIDIAPNVKIEIRNFLKVNGINYYSLYGGLDGLCKYIKDELLEIQLNNK